MFNFWKPKPPEEFLSKIVAKIGNLPDHKKHGFLEKNMTAIRHAMSEDQHSISEYDEQDQDGRDTMEWTLGHLYWHGEIFDALSEEEETLQLNTAALSNAAEYFMNETKADTIAAFHSVFKINPIVAISHLAPAMLFKIQIAEAMESLVGHDNPHLFFKCFDAIQYADDIADKSALSVRLIHATSQALVNMLEKDPEAFLSQEDRRHPFSKSLQNYLLYLPEGMYHQRFINDNINAIDTAIRNIAENATDAQLRGVNDLCYSFPEEVRPAHLIELKDLMLCERVKMCFRLAASDNRHKLSAPVLALDGEKSELVRITSIYGNEPFTPAYELLRLANPDMSPLDPEQDNGADSKHLWMIRKSDKVLAAAFTKAGLIDYLKVQTQHALAEMPSALDIEQFPYQPPTAK